ncbi:MAG: hypothetical protein EOO73_23505 [Myxococcales bacterium]|nr:MAG: hypothetical protein EOO73_23505 [Myxococcales bacterium]
MSTTTSSHGGPGAVLHVTHRARGLLLGTFGDVFFAAWSTKPVPELFELQRSGLASAVHASPGRALFLCVVSPHADPPDQAERDASSRMIASHGARLLGTACVVEGSGFRAAITRTVLTGIVLFTRTPSPVTFFENVDGAAHWMQRRSNGDLSQLAPQLHQVRFS